MAATPSPLVWEFNREFGNDTNAHVGGTVHYFDENGQPSGGHGRTDIFYVDNEKSIDHIAIGYHHPKPDVGEKLLRQYRERMKILDKHLEYNDL